jgi:hypothetical protein
MTALLKWIDKNPRIGKLLTRISAVWAVNRGLPMIFGAALVLLSCGLTGLILPLIVSTEAVADIWLLMCLPALILHGGIFIGFLGFMMSQPMGAGYRE